MTDPLTAGVMIVLGKYALDKGESLLKAVGPAAVKKASELFKTALDYLRREPNGQAIATEFEKAPETYQKPVEKKLDEAVQADPAWAEELRELLSQYQQAAQTYAAKAGISQATLIGSGAISQGGGDALGAGAVKAGNVSGSIITGSGNVFHTGCSLGSSVSLPPTLARLRDKLTQAFNKSELKALCFDLGVAHDDLPGETRTELAQALIEHCHERGRLPELIRRCQEERPQVDWT